MKSFLTAKLYAYAFHFERAFVRIIRTIVADIAIVPADAIGDPLTAVFINNLSRGFVDIGKAENGITVQQNRLLNREIYGLIQFRQHFIVGHRGMDLSAFIRSRI